MNKGILDMRRYSSTDLRIYDIVEQVYEEEHKDKKDKKIHYAGRVYDSTELRYAVNASLDFWLTEGRYCEEFSEKLRRFFDIKDAILVNSGSSANLLAVTALTSDLLEQSKLVPGDEVITTACGFPTTLAPIIQNGLVPVVIDVELGTYNSPLRYIKEAVTQKTKAIILPHTLGYPFDIDIVNFARDNNIWLIEDNCDAFGSKIDGKLTGTLGDMSTLSFYPAHHITTGEGGAVLTNNPLLAKIVTSLRDWGRDCYCKGGRSNCCGNRFNCADQDLPHGYDHKYVYSHVGYNLKMTEIQAAIGCAQMSKVKEFIRLRKVNHSILHMALGKFDQLLLQPYSNPRVDPSWFCFVVTVDDSNTTKNELVATLEQNNIETRALFAGNLTRHPAFRNTKIRMPRLLPFSDYKMEQTFFIGCYPGLDEEDLGKIIVTFNKFFSQKK